MNLVQRAFLRLTGRVVPEFGHILESAGGVREAAAHVDHARELMEAQHQLAYSLETELREARAIAGGGPVVRVSESSIAELELSLEDRGWKRLTSYAQLEFSRYGIQQLILISRLYFLKNPLIKRGVKISSFYVFGRGLQISVPDDDTISAAVGAFMKANDNELGHLGLVEKDQTLRTDGNLYFVLFANTGSGNTTVRTIDAAEIIDIVSDPDDASQPWYYLREWQQETMDLGTGKRNAAALSRAWYPSLEYEARPGMTRPATIGETKVKWESPIYHVKTGGLPKWRFGIPETYASLDWARAYKTFLDNWSKITDALARFAWRVDTKGGSQVIQQFSKVLASTLGSGSAVEQNPPPNTGSAFVSGSGTNLQPIKTSGATTEPEQGRRVMLMVAAADGLPETFYGDASTGSLATAQSLDRPTELQFKHRQELWRQVLQTLITAALMRDARAPGGRLREAYTDAREAQTAVEDVNIQVDFPAVLEHNMLEAVSAIVAGTTLSGYSPAGTVDVRTAARLIMRELGVDDIETVLDEMYPAASYDAEQPDPNEPKPTAPAVPDPAAQAGRMAEAARLLLKAAERFRP